MGEWQIYESWMNLRDHFPVASSSMVVAAFGISSVFLLYRFRARILKESIERIITMIDRFKK